MSAPECLRVLFERAFTSEGASSVQVCREADRGHADAVDCSTTLTVYIRSPDMLISGCLRSWLLDSNDGALLSHVRGYVARLAAPLPWQE